MSKLLVTGNSLMHINKLVRKNIDGIILYLDKLSVNGSFYISLEDIDKINVSDKELFICINKLIHNNELDYLREVLEVLSKKNVRILFYDMAVYNIAKELGIVDRLIIYQDHLNASILSNNFYYNIGIRGSFVTSDITCDELMDIKNNTKMEVLFCCYGYLPIFYSRRYLIRNYLKYINEDNGVNYKIVSDQGDSFIIDEEEYGTTIYTKEIVNLINYLDKLDKIDYIVMNSNKIDDNDFDEMVDKFIKHDKIDGCYIGFFNTKTIYKVK